MSPAQIAATFATADIAVEPAQIERLACELDRYHGDLDRLISQLGHDRDGAEWGSPVRDAYTIALAYSSALRDEADPSRLVARLRRDADALDAKADASVIEGAQRAGQAAGRRARGEISLAEDFERMARACDHHAADCTAEAFEKRLKADQLEGRLNERAAFAELVRAVVLGPHAMAAE